MGLHACLAYEKFAFCDLKMLNFWPYFSLNVFVYNLGDCTAPFRKKIIQLMPNFKAPFSLNVYDFWVLQGGSPLAS